MVPSQAIEEENKAKSMAILEQMLENAKKHVSSVRRYISDIPEDYPGFRDAAIINIMMGVETLKKMENNPDVFYSNSPVKIDKAVSKEIISNPLECFHSL